MMDNIISTFCTKQGELTDDELEKIIMYSISVLNEDNWSISYSTEFNMINGHCKEDKGCFYMFLVTHNLQEKIEIVRG